jgi:hypothetical protein
MEETIETLRARIDRVEAEAEGRSNTLLARIAAAEVKLEQLEGILSALGKK